MPFVVAAPDVEEVTSGEDPTAVAIENARRKARAVEGDLVLGVDTVVVLDGRAHGKPSSRHEAREWLVRLAGREHAVVGGVVLRREGVEHASSARTRVRFRPLSGRDIDWYLGSEEWQGRAGGYAIQGRGAALVDWVDGDFWNVVGLPVAELLRMAPDLVTGGTSAAAGGSPSR